MSLHIYVCMYVCMCYSVVHAYLSMSLYIYVCMYVYVIKSYMKFWQQSAAVNTQLLCYRQKPGSFEPVPVMG